MQSKKTYNTAENVSRLFSGLESAGYIENPGECEPEDVIEADEEVDDEPNE